MTGQVFRLGTGASRASFYLHAMSRFYVVTLSIGGRMSQRRSTMPFSSTRRDARTALPP